MRHTIHLHPTAELAPRVLLPDDPGRALALAQLLFAQTPRMFNHHRGLWGYTGVAHDGEALTVQSTGIGGPSAAIVVSELADLGASRFVRVGTCAALRGDLRLGDLVLVGEALCGDGTSRALGAGERVLPDRGLLTALRDAAPGAITGPVLSRDLFYGDDAAAAGDAIAAELEAAAIFQVARVRGLAAACVLAVSDLAGDGGPERLDRDAVEAAGDAAGRVAARALA